MRHLGFSDGLKYKRVSLANPGFAVRLSRIYPRAGLAFPFDLLILEEQGGGVELVFYLPSVLIMTLIKNWELNHTLMELDWRLTALVQFVASWSVSGVANGGQQNGGYEDRRHENGGHESGDQQNGGHENGGHENGGYENGGYENGGHESGEQQNGGYENGGHENGHGSGGLQNERHEKRRHRSQTSAGHEFGPRGNDGEEHEEHQNEESEDEGYQNKRRRTVAGFEIDRFRPQREEIEASRVTGDA
jgi:hypothetical protein